MDEQRREKDAGKGPHEPHDPRPRAGLPAPCDERGAGSAAADGEKPEEPRTDPERLDEMTAGASGKKDDVTEAQQPR